MYIYVSLFFHVSWMEDPAKERYVCVEPFAAVLVFCSGFAPKLFILSSQCDRSTEKRYGYWYWTCIENKDGAITVSDLVWYFTHIYYILLYIYIYFSIQIPVSILHLAVSHPNIHLFLASWNTTIFFHLAHHISQGRMSPWSDVGDRRSRCSLGLCPVKVDMNVCWSTRHPVITMSDLSETSHTCWILLVRFWNRGVKVDRYH